MKQQTEKGRLFFLLGAIFIFGGFYIDNMDSGRALLTLLGVICLVFGVMSIRKLKKGMGILFFLAFLFPVFVLDYGVVKYFHKAPIFALVKEESQQLHYYGPFYEAYQCDLQDSRNVQFSKKCEQKCSLERQEIKQLEEQLKKKEKKDRSESIVVTLQEKTGIFEDTGEKEYVILTRYQNTPIFGVLKQSDLKSMKVGKKYRITFSGEYPVGELQDTAFFHELMPIKIEEVSEDTIS